MEANSKMSSQFIVEDSWLYIPNGTENTKNLSNDMKSHAISVIEDVQIKKEVYLPKRMWITDNNEFAFCQVEDMLCQYS